MVRNEDPERYDFRPTIPSDWRQSKNRSGAYLNKE
jgi:hypothetical protein